MKKDHDFQLTIPLAFPSLADFLDLAVDLVDLALFLSPLSP